MSRQDPFEQNSLLPLQKTPPLTRRSFLASAGTFGVLAVWFAQSPILARADMNPSGTVTLIEFDSNGQRTGKVVVPHLVKSESAWKSQLSPAAFVITRRAGTERPYSGEEVHGHGIFRCICCNTAVFSSETKFDSGTGWPSFWQPIARENVLETADTSRGMERTAVSCRLCDAHLGHVFDDGPRPTGLRYCMNAAAMAFVKRA